MPGPESAPLLLYLVKQVEQAARARLDGLVRADGLTALQYTALTVLERHDDMSSAQLARLSFVTAQTMAEMITAMEGRGLIERHRDRADRRRLVVALTAEGRALLDRYRAEVDALEKTMLAGLSEPEITALRRALVTCHANLSQAPETTGNNRHRSGKRDTRTEGQTRGSDGQFHARPTRETAGQRRKITP